MEVRRHILHQPSFNRHRIKSHTRARGLESAFEPLNAGLHLTGTVKVGLKLQIKSQVSLRTSSGKPPSVFPEEPGVLIGVVVTVATYQEGYGFNPRPGLSVWSLLSSYLCGFPPASGNTRHLTGERGWKIQPFRCFFEKSNGFGDSCGCNVGRVGCLMLFLKFQQSDSS